MSDHFLIDTSLWTCAIRRKGFDAEREFVQNLVRRDEAAWRDVIRLELWRGVGSEYDRETLRQLQSDVASYPIDGRTWADACRLADVGRSKGLQFPPLDLVIFSCARQHGLRLLSRDKHFEALETLWPLV